MSSLIRAGVSIFRSTFSSRWWLTSVSESRNEFFCGKSASDARASGETNFCRIGTSVSASANFSSYSFEYNA